MVETEITLSVRTFDRVIRPLLELPGGLPEFYSASSSVFGAVQAKLASDTWDEDRGVPLPVTFHCVFNTDEEAVAAKLRWDGE